MFDRRSTLIFGAGPAGLVLASLIWLMFGARLGAETDLDAVETRLAAVAPSAGHGPVKLDQIWRAAATPMFGLTTGQGAVVDPSVAVAGLAITPLHRAALISIDGKPNGWLAVGETRDGVTVIDVQSSRIVVDTPTALKTVGLGDGAANVVTNATAPAPAHSAIDVVPPGYHVPPPPASAPAIDR